ncbi:MAG: hypothetical protein HY998_01745, partial [candidate division NC10 bacterium]|nr:hypothetical protein [candidate division NC10 bacterium]
MERERGNPKRKICLLSELLHEAERGYILEVLKRSGGRRKKAAE